MKLQNFWYLLDNTVSKIGLSVIIRVSSDEMIVHVLVQVVAPRGFVDSAFAGQIEGVCTVLHSNRPGNEAAGFHWRTLEGKKNLWFL